MRPGWRRWRRWWCCRPTGVAWEPKRLVQEVVQGRRAMVVHCRLKLEAEEVEEVRQMAELA